MAYLAMARKWRPRTFEEMVGQEHIAQTLKNAMQSGNIHHAFLFTGTRGVGKTTSARILASMLNCTGENKPCGICESCKSVGSGAFLDILEIDAASNNGVEHMRDILESAQYPPMQSKYKILIIDEVHMLSKAAWNSMLKTLEEPPPHLIFIFATTEANKVLATILSRVLRFDFKRLSPTQISKRLSYICEQEKISVAPEALAIIAEKADGSMRDALTLFDEVFAYGGKNISKEAVQNALGIPSEEFYFEIVDCIEKHNAEGCFNVIEKISAEGIEMQVFLEGLTKFLRNFLYSKIGISAEKLEISQESLDKFKDFAPSLGHGDIMRIARAVSDLQEKCSARHGLNPRLLVEAEFSKLAWLDRVVDLQRAVQMFSEQQAAPSQFSPPPFTPPPQQAKTQVQPQPKLPSPKEEEAKKKIQPLPTHNLKSPYEQELKENPILAEMAEKFGLKFLRQKQEIKNGYAENAQGNAENANPNEEDSGESSESEL